MYVWNCLNYLHHEHSALKDKYDNLLSLVKEILDAVKHAEMIRMENKQKKSKTKCRFYNRGYCKEGEACDFLHQSGVCQEYLCNGSCSRRNQCSQRHPQSCRYWEQGHCWRGETCAFLHKEKDVACSEDYHEELPNDKIDDKNETQEEVQMDPEEEDTHESENFTHTLTTDEIIKMYENVEIDSNDIRISTDEILKMYENDSNAKESWNVQKSTRKCLKIAKQ